MGFSYRPLQIGIMRSVDTIAITAAQLLAIRHLPVPATRSATLSNSAWAGLFTSRKRGQGSDHDDLREYSPGDDIRRIDWRVSARMPIHHTRLYREEKDHRISIVCDLRPSMFTGSEQLRANKAVLLAAKIVWLCSNAGTRINLLLLTPTGVSLMEPGSGHGSAIRACTLLSQEHHRIALTQAKHSSDTPPSKPDSQPVRRHVLDVGHRAQGPTLETLLAWMIVNLEHKSTLLWVSSLDHTGERFLEHVSSLRPPSQSVFLYVDEPMLQAGLPNGEYHYEPQLAANTSPLPQQRNVLINRIRRHQLQRHMQEQWQATMERMATLRLPLISTACGDEDVIAALRHQAYIP